MVHSKSMMIRYSVKKSLKKCKLVEWANFIKFSLQKFWRQFTKETKRTDTYSTEITTIPSTQQAVDDALQALRNQHRLLFIVQLIVFQLNLWRRSEEYLGSKYKSLKVQRCIQSIYRCSPHPSWHFLWACITLQPSLVGLLSVWHRGIQNVLHAF